MDLGELETWIRRHGLVPSERLDQIVRATRETGGTFADVLARLQAEQLLTPHQIHALRKGDFDTLVVGGHRILYRNASGTFARVYRAERISDGRIVAVKVLRQRWAQDPQAVSLFHREAELGRRLRHPNIIPIHEVGSQGNSHWFSMEFVEGGNLRDFIAVRGRLSAAETVRYGIDMAEALEYALAQGFTHRDLKPTNVLMSSTGVASLIDFGLAGHEQTFADDDDEVRTALEYSTLEKWTNAPENDPRTDLYFLGAIFYELLAGIPPYPKTRSREERSQIARYQNIRPLRSLDPNVPREVSDLVERLLQITPASRHQSPTALLDDLRAIDERLSAAGRRTETASSATVAAPVDGSPATGKAEPPRALSVCCVENRPKQQAALRDSLARAGFDVTVVEDPAAALDLLRNSPPDCLVVMGLALGKLLASYFWKVADAVRDRSTRVICILSSSQTPLAARLPRSDRIRILGRDATIGTLRNELERVRDELRPPRE